MESGSVVLDWGTTNLRAYLLAADGSLQTQLHTENGVRSIEPGQFEQVFYSICGDWLKQDSTLAVYAVGMVGSRNGWLEVPYASCPARIEDLARSLVELRLNDGPAIRFVPGLTDLQARPFAEVMRGEETQLFGFGCETDMCVVMPGTHSKWARVGAGVIHAFGTFVTGEMFDLLSKHSFVAGMLTQPKHGHAGPDWAAFQLGCDTALEGEFTARGENTPQSRLLASLFSVRTGFLAGHFTSSSAADYLSGLLICSEFIEASNRWFRRGDEIGIIADSHLYERYNQVANRFELRCRAAPADAVLAGVRAIQAAVSQA